ncbi:hypothetical protein CFOL_v3_09726, partial [Cephalotus follicularis]
DDATAGRFPLRFRQTLALWPWRRQCVQKLVLDSMSMRWWSFKLPKTATNAGGGGVERSISTQRRAARGCLSLAVLASVQRKRPMESPIAFKIEGLCRGRGKPGKRIHTAA